MNDQITFKRLTPGQSVPRPPFRDAALVYDVDGDLKLIDGDTGEKKPLSEQVVGVVEANSATPALRVTQTGSGDALLVEDSAHPDSTPLVINNLGQIISGATTAFSASAGLQLTADSSSAPNAVISIRRCSDTTNGSLNILRTRGSAAAPTSVQNGDLLGGITFAGFDGTGNRFAAGVLVRVDGTTGPNIVPTSLSFSTAPEGSSADVTRMVINNQGNVGIGSTAPNAKLTVEHNDTSPAVRITQTGTGNALVVEDDTHPDSTPLVVNNLGQIISGATTAVEPDSGLQLVSSTNSAPNGSVTLSFYDSSGFGNNASFRSQRARGSASSPEIVQNGDLLGSVVFRGHDGSAFRQAANIVGLCDGTPGASDMPGALSFRTTADGASTVTERMRITSAGNVGIGTTANAAAILDVASTTKGFLPPRMTTTQRNDIAAPIPAGLMVYNTSTNKLNFYNGTAWEAVTSS